MPKVDPSELSGDFTDIAFPEYLTPVERDYLMRSFAMQLRVTQGRIDYVQDKTTEADQKIRMEAECKTLVYGEDLPDICADGISLSQSIHDRTFITAALQYCQQHETVSDTALYRHLYHTLCPNWLDADGNPDTAQFISAKVLTDAEKEQYRIDDHPDDLSTYDPAKSFLQSQAQQDDEPVMGLSGTPEQLLECSLNNQSLRDVFQIFRMSQFNSLTPFEQDSMLFQMERDVAATSVAAQYFMADTDDDLMDLTKAYAKSVVYNMDTLVNGGSGFGDTAEGFRTIAQMKVSYEYMQACFLQVCEGTDASVVNFELIMDDMPEI